MPDEIRSELLEVCRLLWERGLIAGRDGNVSVRRHDGSILVTPASMAKRECAAGDLVLVDADGSHLAGARSASSELDIHLRIYRERADVSAVLHAHPPIATGFALAGETLPPDASAVLPAEALPLRDEVRAFEARCILNALERSDWNQSRAAELLKVPLRTLVRRMSMHGIRKRFGSDEAP